jgi:uncharacterized membrane protein YvbJ
MYCPDCGTQNYESDNFCIKCGKQFAHVLQNPIQTTKTIIVDRNDKGEYSIPDIKDKQQINIVFNPNTTVKTDTDSPVAGFIFLILFLIFVVGPCCAIV